MMLRIHNPRPNQKRLSTLAISYVRALIFVLMKEGVQRSSHFRLMLDSYIDKFIAKEHEINPNIQFGEMKLFVPKPHKFKGKKLRLFVLASGEQVDLDEVFDVNRGITIGDVRQAVIPNGGLDDREAEFFHAADLDVYKEYLVSRGLEPESIPISKLEFLDEGLLGWKDVVVKPKNKK